MVLYPLVLPFHGHRSDFMLYNSGELGESPRPIDAVGVLLLLSVEPTFNARCPNKKGLWRGWWGKRGWGGRNVCFFQGHVSDWQSDFEVRTFEENAWDHKNNSSSFCCFMADKWQHWLVLVVPCSKTCPGNDKLHNSYFSFYFIVAIFCLSCLDRWVHFKVY